MCSTLRSILVGEGESELRCPRAFSARTQPTEPFPSPQININGFRDLIWKDKYKLAVDVNFLIYTVEDHMGYDKNMSQFVSVLEKIT